MDDRMNDLLLYAATNKVRLSLLHSLSRCFGPRLGKPVKSMAAGQAISIFARAMPTWWLPLLAKPACEALRFCDDLFSGGELYARDHTGGITLAMYFSCA